MNPYNIHPAQEANNTIRHILRTQWDGVPALRIDSPPGAGKTYIVELLAAQSAELLRERCMIATQTNAQAFDLARRLARGFSKLIVTLFSKSSLTIPVDMKAMSNLHIIHDQRHLPDGPCVVIANSAKWSWIKGFIELFDVQLVDEAFQMPDHRFHQISGLARRVVLIGDPGQIGPVISCEIERWHDDPTGPHVPCPDALLHRHPDIKHIQLPVSRRLVPDTVHFIQPAFYKDMPFKALSLQGERSLNIATTTSELLADELDRALSMASSGASMLQLTLPPRMTGEVDHELAEIMVETIQRLICRETWLQEQGTKTRVTPAMIGVVCAHVAQVSAIQERLGAALSGVYVETSDRFQGLERPIMLVHHPLSGRADADEFHLDAGRLCVMLSRHRIACFIFGRQGLLKQLESHVPTGERILGQPGDAIFEGWKAHHTLLKAMQEKGRVVPLHPGH